MVYVERNSEVRTPQQVVGLALRARRNELGLTQEQAGQRIGRLLGREWSRSSMSIAEDGGRNFGAAELVAIAAALETSIDALFRPPLGVVAFGVPGGVVPRMQVAGSAATDHDPAQYLEALRTGLSTIPAVAEKRDEVIKVFAESIANLAETEGKAVKVIWDSLNAYEKALTTSAAETEE